VVLGVGADLDVERHPPEEAPVELEDKPVAPGSERRRQLRDAPIGVGDASGNDGAVLFERD